MTDREILAIVGGLALGFLVVWFFIGDKASSKRVVPPAAAAGDVIEGVVLSEKPDTENAAAGAWRSKLGVGPQATREEVDAAYQALCRQYDVSRLEEMAPELRQIAQTRRAQIDEAYRQCVADRKAAGA